MSLRYKGAVISATPPTTSSSGAAGSWTLQQQMQAQAGGNWPFGGPFVYIEDVFSTWLYTGTNAAQTITNGIDLSTKGGMVWVKDRDATWSHEIFDTARGAPYGLYTNSASAQVTENDFGSFLTNGFSFDGAGVNNGINVNGDNYASWTFRKQPKFFDVVTYTGTGSTQTINHNLGSVPGCILVKATSLGSVSWRVYHRSLGATKYLILNTTDAATTRSTDWNDTEPTSTQFTVGSASQTNDTAVNYVAYLFAHNAGGFGSSNADNVISCGSYTGNGSTAGPVIDLGYEPQWVMIKRATGGTGNWYVLDNMRGIASSSNGDGYLFPNLSSAETYGDVLNLSATGFQIEANGTAVNASGSTYIYIAIRRGPMKTPTSGASVFAPVAQAGGGFVTTNFPVDSIISTGRTNPSAVGGIAWLDRLRGSSIYSVTSSTAAETNAGTVLYGWNYSNVGAQDYAYAGTGASGIYWNFRRAPGFFDEVCLNSGLGYGSAQPHNLGVAPELVISKYRGTTGDWWAWHTSFTGQDKTLVLNTTAAAASGLSGYGSPPTSTNIYVGNCGVLGGGATQVVYLFASVAGVSKVGSYTGTGTTKQIDCGFTGGARFVLIKRTDSTGDWYVWDSARGIVAGNDPYLLLNSTAAEVTNTDYVDAYAAGFEISSTAPAAINANGGTFIFLAVS